MTNRKILLAQHMQSHGGIDRVATYLANGFAEHGYDTRQLIFCAGGPAQSLLTPEPAQNVKLSFLGKRGSLGRSADLLRLLPRFIAYLRADPPDVLISTANNMHWICSYALAHAGLRRCKLALKITNPILRAKDGPLWHAARAVGYRRSFAKADGIWTLSRAESQKLCAAFPEMTDKIHAVINPYVSASMLAAAEQPHSPETPPLLLAIGRLNVQKNFALLLRGFAALPRGSAQLVILGEGEERAALQGLIRQYGLEDHVRMPGFVDDVTPWLARASLFILPSRYEGLPAVLLEAMAANCPVLTTDCFPAARALLEDQPGAALIIPPTAERLAELISQMLAAPRPHGLATTAQRWSVPNGVASHIAAIEAFF